MSSPSANVRESFHTSTRLPRGISGAVASVTAQNGCMMNVRSNNATAMAGTIERPSCRFQEVTRESEPVLMFFASIQRNAAPASRTTVASALGSTMSEALSPVR